MYKILADEAEFDKFVNFLPELEKDEVYYLSLFGRHKYCSSLPNMRDNQLVRFTSNKTDLKEKVKRLECQIGGYRRDGEDVPQEALALYIAINPRNLVKANKELLVELAKCCAEGKFSFNPLSLARTAVHRAVGRKVFVDFDYDHVSPEEYLPEIRGILPSGSYSILRTRGGFHLIVRLGDIKGNWFVSLRNLKGCDVKGSNTLCPVAGCVQGGYIPKLELY
jgi:hypothetical protein